MCEKDSDIIYIKLLRHLATFIFYNYLLKDVCMYTYYLYSQNAYCIILQSL